MQSRRESLKTLGKLFGGAAVAGTLGAVISGCEVVDVANNFKNRNKEHTIATNGLTRINTNVGMDYFSYDVSEGYQILVRLPALNKTNPSIKDYIAAHGDSINVAFEQMADYQGKRELYEKKEDNPM